VAAANNADVVGDVLGQTSERVGGLALVEDDRLATVAASPDGGIERNRSEEGEILFVSEILATTATEDVVSAVTVGTPELRHVLGDAEDGGFVLAEHPQSLDGVVEGDLAIP